MESKKIKNRTQLVIYILAILALIGVVNYLATHLFTRVDMTEGKDYSISPSTKKVLKGLNDIINIKVYFSKNLPPNLHNTVTDVKDLLSEYQVYAGKNLHITWEDPSTDSSAKQQARSLGIPEIQMQTFERDKAQVINGYLGIAVLYEDKKEALPIVQNLGNLEYDLTTAIMKVSRKSVPKVGIVKVDTMPELPPQYQQQNTNPESQTTEQKFSSVYENLRNNYDVSTVDLSKNNPIDSSIKTLIVPGTSTLSDRKLFEIDQFFMHGGNLIVLADAINVSFQYGVNAVPNESNLFKMLENYGVKVEKNLVLDASCGQVEIPQQVGPFQMNVPVPYPYFVHLGAENFAKGNPAVSPLSDVVFPWVSPLSLNVDKNQNETRSVVLAHSSKKSWQLKGGNLDLNPQQKWILPPQSELKESNLAVFLEGNFKSYFAGKPIPSVSQPATTDTTLKKINLQNSAQDTNRQIVAANPKGRLVVVGDADFITGQNATQQNIAMLVNLVDWFSLDDNLISIRTRAIKNRTIDSDMLKNGSAKPNIVRFVNIVTMPAVVIFIGLIIFLRRREIIPVAAQTSVTATNQEKTEGKQ